MTQNNCDDSTKMNWAFWTGVFIVVVTHIGMILNVIPMASMLSKTSHAIVNLIAAGLIVYSRRA